MVMKTDGAWRGLEIPKLGALTAKRADPAHPYDYFYAVNAEGQFLLVLNFTENVNGERDLPRLKGVRVQWVPQTNSLHLVLAKAQDVDLFTLLCRDLLDSTFKAGTQLECFEKLCTRLLKWQRLLTKGGPRLLDAHQMRGLFAELSFLKKELLARYGASAVEAWKGPSGFPQDFAVDNKVFEIKSHLVGAQQSIRISSPSQLWVEGADLYLCVCHLAEVSSGGQTLAALVEELSNGLSGHASASEDFENKLISLGYMDLPDYRVNAFAVVKFDTYLVSEGFPRIAPGGLMPGIHDVTYGIQLAALTPFSAPISWKGE